MTNDLTTWIMLALAAIVGTYFLVRFTVIARHFKASRPGERRISDGASSARSPGPSTDRQATDDADNGHAIPF